MKKIVEANFSRNHFRSLPGHVSREVIVIMSSLSTVDPGNIFSTFEVPTVKVDSDDPFADLRVDKPSTLYAIPFAVVATNSS